MEADQLQEHLTTVSGTNRRRCLLDTCHDEDLESLPYCRRRFLQSNAQVCAITQAKPEQPLDRGGSGFHAKASFRLATCPRRRTDHRLLAPTLRSSAGTRSTGRDDARGG